MLEGLVPAAKALEIVLAGAAPLGVEDLELKNAAGRILAKTLAARRTQPPFPASAMDGYALRAADVATCPVVLKVVGEAAAGRAFAGHVGPGEAVRIFTGSPVPMGADAVVIQENTQATATGHVKILTASQSGRFIRPAGLDFKQGDELLMAGDRLDPARLSLAASMNYPSVPVYVRPKIALSATGDELAEPGNDLADAAIVSSNIYGLAALIADAGGEPIDLGITRDTRKKLRTVFERAIAAGADLVITTGGASVGDHDLVKPAWLEMGARLHFGKIAMRPGKPFLCGEIVRDGRKIRLLGLAGNPVSSLIAAMVFVRPLVGLLAGRTMEQLKPVPAITGGDLAANDEREDYLRASARRDGEGTLVATAFPQQDSSMLALLARADCLLVRAAHAPAAKTGSPCQAIMLKNI